MKTRQHDPSGTPGLPPAPAPPSRDANPWPMSAEQEIPRQVHPRVRVIERKREERRQEAATPRHPRAGGQRRLAWLPYLIAVFVAASAIRLLIEALESGAPETAAGPLLLLVFAGIVAWRRMRRKR